MTPFSAPGSTLLLAMLGSEFELLWSEPRLLCGEPRLGVFAPCIGVVTGIVWSEAWLGAWLSEVVRSGSVLLIELRPGIAPVTVFRPGRALVTEEVLAGLLLVLGCVASCAVPEELQDWPVTPVTAEFTWPAIGMPPRLQAEAVTCDPVTPLARVVSGDPATPWRTDWYTTPYFGNLYAGTGLLLDLGHTVTVSSVQLSLGTPGASLQLRSGDEPVLAGLRTVATSDGAGSTVELPLTSPDRARYLLIWFTKLPPDNAGTYQASVYDIVVQGQS